MRGASGLGSWFRPLFSLLLLAANVAAPFRTGTLVRVVLSGPWHHAATAPMVRVRAVTQVGVTQGFRAVVGLARGGHDTTPGAASARLAALSPLQTHPIPSFHGDRSVAHLHRPLRC